LEKHQIIELIKYINSHCVSNLRGVNCTDSTVCNGSCCYSSQEIPKILAEEYQKMNLISELDVLRSQQQLFRLKINPITNRCIFFDINQNHCKIYNTRLIPPQCANYPLSTEKYQNQCRKHHTFQMDEEKGRLLDKLKKEYINFTQEEFEQEYSESAIRSRFKIEFIQEMRMNMPSKIIGIKDALNGMKPIVSEHFSWEMLQFCDNTKDCNQDYTYCPSICENCLKYLIPLITEKIYRYIQNNFPRDEYFFQLFGENS
jgi:Fe-S-cluster containining protein